MANAMSLPARKLLALLFAVPLFHAVGTLGSAGLAPASNGLICHTDKAAECYPRLFEATNEFQRLHDDQDIPAGLHVRLNVWTGEKEAKLYNASEDSTAELEGLPVDRAVVLVDQPGSGEADADAEEEAARRIPKGAPEYDAVGAVKEPVGGEGKDDGDAISFADAVAVVKGVGLRYERANEVVADAERMRFIEALEQLGEFAHDIYYGSRLAEDKDATRLLLCLMTADDDGLGGVAQQQAGAIVAAAVQNNPTALRGVEREWEQHKTAPCSHESTLGEGVFKALGAAGDVSPAWVRSRLSAINGLIRSETIMQDFLEHDGLTEILRLLVTLTGPKYESTRARAAHLVIDNFLDANMGADVTRWPLEEATDSPVTDSCDPDVQAQCWDYHAERLAETYAAAGRQQEDDVAHWSAELWRLLQERRHGARRDEL
ncbi:sls1 protein precursor-like protein [Grosmannia clavigera kw1407]|uniref:Nucleotide exchange factor SIL1 n=1 Tax=Grosmannia clavigera (strain kw1407 / UAMH 11150) TaxID=655863 RepID=F0XRN9_GROCL|nr:sls1 protein precursor-like protein [Grosmannia clavigera kw1407]EFW99568.1 sls1 protein precursor-like protein [Grosmannia clavigera kw1407]